jgi:YVTN family beta-propeller protein
VAQAWLALLLAPFVLFIVGCGSTTAPPPNSTATTTNCGVHLVATNPLPLSASTQVLLGGRPYSVAMAPGGLAYVSQLDSATLAAVAPPAYSFTARVGVGSVPTEVAFNSSGTQAFVTNQVSQTVGLIDVASNVEIASVHVTGNPFAVIVAPGDSEVYVSTTADTLS